ncbi:MAG: histidine phosphatase family protein [Acidobacteriaceae bacterium]|nr:histidine phosphatase family protein [Acidobacteriaceae bacterium]
MKGENSAVQVHLLRHGIAEDGHAGLPDADRALTSDGRKKLRQVLQTAAKANVQPTLILSSPLKRALQTAEIAKRTLRYHGEILQTKVLAPGSSVEQVWDEIRAHRDENALLLTGHNPLFEQLAGYLLNHPSMKMDFKKGALLRIDIETFGAEPRGILRWCITAKLAESGK